MSGQHTPRRLVVKANGDANSYALLDDAGKWWMSVLLNGEQLTATQEDNLRRLAACWNACEGITTEALEKMPAPFAKLLSAEFLHLIDEMTAARALLRDLLEDCDEGDLSLSLTSYNKVRSYLDACDTLGGGA